MSRTSVASLLSAHLGVPTHAAGLVAARTFRSITVTYHRVRDAAWGWRPQGPYSSTSASAAPHAGVLFSAEGRPVPTATARPGHPAPLGLFLPPHAEQVLDWEDGSEVLAIWVPAPLLQEFTEGGMPDATVLYASPLTIGFRTFAQAVVRHADDGSSMSRYAIERLLAEMTFGSLVEQQSVETAQRPSSLIERARSVMLMRREDPAFSTPQLAAELHISPRQLQRAFARAGVTPGDLLRRMRVELAESMLRNPLYSGLTVDEVSRYAGFTSALQLRRALQAEGSPSPTELRRAESGAAG
ncbi:helix-turn-helix domain-containing protein [Microbacterium sp.]|uniref:helix-turn-helix domain-containing protein n=1 Tax=Microbacterium sp. TaxID=51671 RepID=UPI0028126752|nr:helix-turn-helix domain-containing protein [Microbacterium sp.]